MRERGTAQKMGVKMEKSWRRNRPTRMRVIRLYSFLDKADKVSRTQRYGLLYHVWLHILIRFIHLNIYSRFLINPCDLRSYRFHLSRFPEICLIRNKQNYLIPVQVASLEYKNSRMNRNSKFNVKLKPFFVFDTSPKTLQS